MGVHKVQGFSSARVWAGERYVGTGLFGLVTMGMDSDQAMNNLQGFGWTKGYLV